MRAGLVESPAQWAWSSYRANSGDVPSPSWLATQDVHAFLAARLPTDSMQAAAGGRRYANWVAAGRGVRLWANSLRMGAYLGDDAFIERVEKAANELGAL